MLLMIQTSILSSINIKNLHISLSLDKIIKIVHEYFKIKTRVLYDACNYKYYSIINYNTNILSNIKNKWTIKEQPQSKEVIKSESNVN